MNREEKKPTPRSFSERARDVFPIAIAHLRRGVLHLQELENRGAVVGDRDVPDVVHEHLVEAHGAERGLHDVRHRLDRHDCWKEGAREGRRKISSCRGVDGAPVGGGSVPGDAGRGLAKQVTFSIEKTPRSRPLHRPDPSVVAICRPDRSRFSGTDERDEVRRCLGTHRWTCGHPVRSASRPPSGLATPCSSCRLTVYGPGKVVRVVRGSAGLRSRADV